MTSKMKQSAIIMAAVLSFMGMTACSQENTKAEATAFANRFASFVDQNNLDSIRALYPDAEECDSFALTYNADSMRVEANEMGDLFTVTLGKGKDFVVAKSEEGKMIVTNSHGLVAYRADDISFAKSIGQYKEGLTDVKLARRMAVKEFKHNLISSFVQDMESKVEVGKLNREVRRPMFAADEGIGAVTIKNATSMVIDGNDYKVDIFADGQHGSGTYEVKGKKIPANGFVNLQFTYAGNTYPRNALVTFVLSDEELFSKYYKATGNEFDKYLKNHGIDLDGIAEEQKTASNQSAAPVDWAKEDAEAEKFIQYFYDVYVWGDGDFYADGRIYCTKKMLKKLKDDYEYDGDGYAIWDFRSPSQEGPLEFSEVKSVKRVGNERVYQVKMSDMGIPYTSVVTLIKNSAGKLMIDDVK